jgi:molybdopterin synthase catalytic subunit
MFSITHEPIVYKEKIGAQCGARVIFDGTVRNHNDGHDVSSLEYQAYEEMAEIVGNQVVQTALDKFDIVSAHCIHRVGHLSISDIAVIVDVTSVHREEAFRACEYIIDEVKLLVPIWKKEHYIGMDSTWVQCHRCTEKGHEHSIL